jgi:hypothetical protein
VESAWKVLNSDNFNIHFDSHQRALAEYILPQMVHDLEFIEDRIGYRLSGRVDVFLYPSAANYTQSQLKAQSKELVQIDGGIVEVRGFDLEVHFDGIKEDLFRDLRRGIARNLITEMLYGGTTQERIKYNTLLNLPDWFELGLIEYLALGWDDRADDELRDIVLNNQWKNFTHLSHNQQKIVGRSLWKYLDEKKGDLSIPRILYLVRLTRKLETAFYFVFNASSNDLYKDWQMHQEAIFSDDMNRRVPGSSDGLTWHASEHHISQIKLSPDNKNILFVVQSEGMTELRIREIKSGLEKSVYTRGTNKPQGVLDPMALVCTWDADGNIWVVDNTTRLKKLYQIVPGKGIQNSNELPYSSVLSIAKGQDKSEMLLSGVMNGITDLFSFNILTEESTQLSFDWNDELDIFPDNKGNFYYTSFIYDSSRATPRYSGQSDIFYFIRGIGETNVTFNLTQSENVDESKPLKLGEGSLSYLSNTNGISNAFVKNTEEIAWPITDYRFGILEQSVSHNKKYVVELVRNQNKYWVFHSEVDLEQIQTPIFGDETHWRKYGQLKHDFVAEVVNPKDSLIEIVANEVYFQSEFDLPDNIDSIERVNSSLLSDRIWSKIEDHQGYKLKVNRLYSQIDNSYLFKDVFPNYLGAEEQMKNKVGLLFGAGFSDQMRRNHVTGLLRTSLNFNNLQLGVTYLNRSEKIERQVQIWRQSQMLISGETFLRNVTVSLNSQYDYAFTDKWNIGGFANFRQDKLLPLATEEEALRTQPRQYDLWKVGQFVEFEKMRYVLNSKNGFESRIDASLLLNEKGNTGGEVKWNATYYKSLSPRIEWKVRLCGAMSFGAVQRRYILGGTAQEIRANYNRENVIQETNSRYYEPIFGLRAFSRNTRNGNSYTLLNTDISMPLSKIIAPRPLSVGWLDRTFVLVFAEGGSAWYGMNPWSKDNPRNSTFIKDGILKISVYNIRQPFVMSLGTGMKTKIYGYTLRYDLGWGLDNGVWHKAVSHLSLGKEF